jgi:hypothetical protein
MVGRVAVRSHRVKCKVEQNDGEVGQSHEVRQNESVTTTEHTSSMCWQGQSDVKMHEHDVSVHNQQQVVGKTHMVPFPCSMSNVQWSFVPFGLAMSN